MNKTGEYIKSRQDILSVYFTAGYPQKESTKEIILALQTAGAGLIEVGIPFSDPLADGPVIQKSGEVALENGFTLQELFQDLKGIQTHLKIPLVLMGYFNTAFAFGVESFLNNCNELNIDTIILPDLPVEVYEKSYRTLFMKYGVSPVFLISPQTSEQRISLIDSLSNAFIYVVSDNSITGSKSGFSTYQLDYFQRIKDRQLSAPQLIGFGISDAATFSTACHYANGAIVGSSFIKQLSADTNIQDTVSKFMLMIKSK